MNARAKLSGPGGLEKQEEVRALAQSIWQSARPAASHPWLDSRGCPGAGLKQRNGRIIVPMFDFAGQLWNLQFIGPDGGARCLHGGRIFGVFHRIGDPQSDSVILAARFADAARAQSRDGGQALACVTPWNVRNVATIIRAFAPHARISFAPMHPERERPEAPSGFTGIEGGAQ